MFLEVKFSIYLNRRVFVMYAPRVTEQIFNKHPAGHIHKENTTYLCQKHEKFTAIIINLNIGTEVC